MFFLTPRRFLVLSRHVHHPTSGGPITLLLRQTAFQHRCKSTKLLSPTPRKVENLTPSATIAKVVQAAIDTTPKATKVKKSKGHAQSKRVIITEAEPQKVVVSEVKPPTGCWVDASPTRIAILIGDQYKVFALKEGWQEEKRDVNWAEMIAFELLAQVLIAKGKAGVINVNSDSATALRAIKTPKNKIPGIFSSSQRLRSVLEQSAFKMKGVKVARKENLADPFTRGRVTEGYERMKEHIVIPQALVPFVEVV